MNLSFVNGLFFTLVTTLTIGFGDIVPTTEVQRVVVCIYASFGIIILGAAVRLMGVAVVEGLEVGSRMRVRAYKYRRRERRKEAREQQRWRYVVEEKLQTMGVAVWVPDECTLPGRKLSLSLAPSTLLSHETTITMPKRFRLNTEALSSEQLQEAAQMANVPLEQYVHRRIPKPIKHERSLHFGHASHAVQSSGTGIQTAGQNNEHTQSQPVPKRNWWSDFYRKVISVKDILEEKPGMGTMKALQIEERRALYVKVNHPVPLM